MSETPAEYNAQTVINEAKTKLQSEGIQSAQLVYQSALMEWVDDVTMGDSVHVDTVRGEVAKLWLAYASLNKTSNLFKSATEVYDQATRCPVAGPMGLIWQEFAKFLEERARPKTAQKLYLRSLIGDEGSGPAVKDPNDQVALWNGFLHMMQTLRNKPDLTLEELKKAVEQETGGCATQSSLASTTADATMQPAEVTSAPLPQTVTSSTEGVEEPMSRPAKRSRWERIVVETETISAITIDSTASLLFTTAKNMPPEIETLWFARDGGALPAPPEPPLFTASPPKLGNPAGKNLIGNDAALKILKLLTATTHDGKSLGSAVLDVCHSCWLMAAIKEEEVSKSREVLEKKMTADTETMEHELEARALMSRDAVTAVQQANERERSTFQRQIAAQRQQLHISGAWEFRKLLYTQQIMLSSMKLPGFDGPTVDSSKLAIQAKVCSVMHSAFYLRTKVGEASHVNMLNKQLETLEKMVPTSADPSQAQFQTIPQQQQFQMPPQPMQQFQQPVVMPNFAVPPPPFQQSQPIMGYQQQLPVTGYQQMVPQQGQQMQQQQQQYLQFLGQS